MLVNCLYPQKSAIFSSINSYPLSEKPLVGFPFFALSLHVWSDCRTLSLFSAKKRELKLSDLFIVTSEIFVHFFRFIFYKRPIDLIDLIQIREESNIPKDVQNAMVVAYEFTSVIFRLIIFHSVNYVLSKFFISHLIHLIIFFFAQKFFFTKFLDTLDSLFCKFKI